MLLALTDRIVKDRLRRPLHGKPDPLVPTGEHAVLAALAQGRLDVARAALAAGAAKGTKLGDDFVRLVSRLLVAGDAPPGTDSVKRYEVDIPMPIWHQIARQAREQARPIRRVLTDYLLRGWDEAQRDRRDALDARAGLREDLRLVRQELADLREQYRHLHPAS